MEVVEASAAFLLTEAAGSLRGLGLSGWHLGAPAGQEQALSFPIGCSEIFARIAASVTVSSAAGTGSTVRTFSSGGTVVARPIPCLFSYSYG
ncbi:hypothetical protein AB0M29_36725 [Streptomyces sp. NPDC051976]|uniref:hypothetical protein n=1 Tax=Streptomyces sp. NPDC051976 TaxID=3154947 RepID=UPI0034199CA5